jgi:hypothetical protein
VLTPSAAARQCDSPGTKDVIDIAAKNHTGYLVFGGGEPLVHKELGAMQARGIFVCLAPWLRITMCQRSWQGLARTAP